MQMSYVTTSRIRRRIWKAGTIAIALITIFNVTSLGSIVKLPSADATGGTMPTPVANPALAQSCGLDIGLIVDRSGSMDNTEMTQVKSALTGFVTAFAGTPTQFSLTKFDTNAQVVQAFTADLDLVKSKINSIPAGGDNTNWDAALAKSFSTFDPRTSKPNLIVFATDGSPNRHGDPATSTFDWNQGLSKAITRANAIKTAGTRIVVIGIGSDTSDPDYPNTDVKLKAVSGPKMAPPATIDETVDVVKTDFATLSSAMSSLAKGLCGGKILVQKQFDTNGDGQADVDGTSTNALLAGWNFDVNGSPSNPAAQVTTNTGALDFDVLNGTYSVTETLKAGTHLVSAECRNGQTVVGNVDLSTQTVSNLTMSSDATIACSFVNASSNGTLKVIKQVVGGTLPSSSWQMHVKKNGTDVTGSPAAGSTTGTTYTLPAGTYKISETGPTGYSASFSKECDNGDVTVVAGQETVCTVTNTLIPVYGITLDKKGPSTVNAGASMTYSLEWSIEGNSTQHEAVITDPIPANTTFVSADNGGIFSNGVVTWNLGTKAAGDEGIVKVTVQVASPLVNGTSLKNTACFDTKESGKVCDEITTKVTSEPTVSLKKTGPATVTAGGNILYTLTWTVGGNAPVSNAVITDPIPAHTTYVDSNNGGTFSNGIVTWNLGAKQPGDTGSVTILVKSASPITNGTVVTNTACFDTTETEVACDTTTTKIESAPQISIVKTNDVTTFTNPGKTVKYTVVVTNAATATEDAKDVKLTDTLPAGFTFVDGGTSTKTFDLGTIAPGASVTTVYDVVISTTQVAGTYTNTADAKGSNTEKVSDTSDVEVRIPEILGEETTPDLKITKKVGKSIAKPGDVVTYTVTVTSIGTEDAHNVIVTDTLPKNLSFKSFKGRSHTWKLGTLAVGKSVVIEYDVRVESDVKRGTYKNVAVVKADKVGKKQATAKLEVRTPTVLGAELPVTGAGPLDIAAFAIGGLLAGIGLIGLRKRGNENDEPTNFIHLA